MLQNKNPQECGQALVGGLVFILITLLFGAYFLYVCEAFGRRASNEWKAQEKALAQAAQVANAINEISINNQSIVAAVIESQNAFAKAFELGTYLSYEQPYWETYKSFNQKQSATEHSNQMIKQAYTSYAMNASRGFFVAKALSERNKKLVEKLPSNISKYFKQSENAQVHCFALETQRKRYGSPGFISFPIPKTYSFFLTKTGCRVEHKTGSLTQKISKSIPLFSFADSDAVLSYERIDESESSSDGELKNGTTRKDEKINLKNKNNQYGIWFVDPKNAQLFVRESLSFSLPKDVDLNPKYSVIENFLSKIPFFYDAGLGKKKSLSHVLSNTHVQISHPQISCLQDQKCKDADADFMGAFFLPHWAPLLKGALF